MSILVPGTLGRPNLGFREAQLSDLLQDSPHQQEFPVVVGRSTKTVVQAFYVWSLPSRAGKEQSNSICMRCGLQLNFDGIAVGANATQHGIGALSADGRADMEKSEWTEEVRTRGRPVAFVIPVFGSGVGRSCEGVHRRAFEDVSRGIRSLR